MAGSIPAERNISSTQTWLRQDLCDDQEALDPTSKFIQERVKVQERVIVINFPMSPQLSNPAPAG